MSELLKLEGTKTPTVPNKLTKASERFAEAIQKIRGDMKLVQERQEQARQNIIEYKNELAQTAVDVATVQDESKKREHLATRERIRGLIEEENIYLDLKMEDYKLRRVEEENLERYRVAAGKEYKKLFEEVRAYQEQLDKATESKRLAERQLKEVSFYSTYHSYETLLQGKTVHWTSADGLAHKF